MARLIAFALVTLFLVSPQINPPPAAAQPAGNAALIPAATHRLFLPLVRQAGPCATASGWHYAAGGAAQWDTDNPVRPAWNHADKNIALRGYKRNTSASLRFVNYGSDDPTTPPQLATLFNPARVPAFTNGYQIYNWNWAPSPNPGTRSSQVNTTWPVTVLGLATTPGEALRVPASGYNNIGGGFSVIVLYADEDTIAINFTREDSAATGYTVHIDNVCTDSNLLKLYNQLDAPGGPRYVYYSSTPSLAEVYNLPNLPAGQVFGVARSSEIRVAIVDSGSWMDPRSCDEWWQIRPGRNC
jgi:hypothetical protein